MEERTYRWGRGNHVNPQDLEGGKRIDTLPIRTHERQPQHQDNDLGDVSREEMTDELDVVAPCLGGWVGG